MLQLWTNMTVLSNTDLICMSSVQENKIVNSYQVEFLHNIWTVLGYYWYIGILYIFTEIQMSQVHLVQMADDKLHNSEWQYGCLWTSVFKLETPVLFKLTITNIKLTKLEHQFWTV